MGLESDKDILMCEQTLLFSMSPVLLQLLSPQVTPIPTHYVNNFHVRLSAFYYLYIFICLFIYLLIHLFKIYFITVSMVQTITAAS